MATETSSTRDSTTITLDLDPGTYDYVCEYHEADGMVGTVTVE